MMKKVSIMILASGFALTAMGIGQDIPTVPRQVDFANMKLILTDGAAKEIQDHVNALRNSDHHFQIQLDRVNLYFPLIEEILKEENVPDDFKFLVIQESGLISDAVSSANAVGYWQFKDFTAREVGLRVDNRIDERKNIVASTRAAAKYLKRNNFQYDNWVYAMSAYQAGVGGARKYVDRKFFGAKKITIKKNTHWYIKKYIAHKIAFEQEVGEPHSEGLSLTTYSRGEGKDLAKVAREVKVESDLLKHYNKWIKFGKIPEDKDYVVVVPVTRSNRAAVAEVEREAVPEIEIPVQEEIVYPSEIKPGITTRRGIQVKINGIPAIMATELDDIETLSAVKGLSGKQLLMCNDLAAGSVIKPGEVYFVGRKKKKSQIGFHVAKEGETLWSISQLFGIRLKSLARKNRISIIDEIKPGQVIWLNSRRPKRIPIEYHDIEELEERPPATPPPLPVVSGERELAEPEAVAEVVDEREEDPPNTVRTGKTHTVVAGETLWAISRSYDVTVEEIRTWNDMTRYDELSIGKELFVEEPQLKTKRRPRTKVYTVKPGDTLYQIAEAHNMEVGELMDLNNKDNSYLSVGEELKVYRNN